MSEPSFNKISQDRAPDTKKIKLPIEEVYYRNKNQLQTTARTQTVGKNEG
jgi:hypothetical protein